MEILTNFALAYILVMAWMGYARARLKTKKHFLVSEQQNLFPQHLFPARLNWETFASATTFPSFLRLQGCVRLRAVSLLLENLPSTSHARAAKPQVARAPGEERLFSLVCRRARYSQLCRSRVTRARLLFPRGFSSKRETARSLRLRKLKQRFVCFLFSFPSGYYLITLFKPLCS